MDPFDPQKETWRVFFQRLQTYIADNNVSPDKHVPFLLLFLNTKTLGLLKGITENRDLSTFTLNQIHEILDQFYHPKIFVNIERFRFNSATQHQDESMRRFVSRVKTMAQNCRFGDFYEQAVRDRLICGLHFKFEQLQKALLHTDDLDLATTEQILLSTEKK